MAYTSDGVALAAIEEGLTARASGPAECLHPVISPRGIQIALATELVESAERVLANPNVPESYNYPNDGEGYDHNSTGPFQQQPQWWGTVAEEMDPRLSAAMFYNHLARLNYNSNQQSPGSFAQAVQGSAFPDRYDTRWNDAVAQYNRLISQVGSHITVPVIPPFSEIDLTQNNENCESRGGFAPRLFILHTEEGAMTGSAFEQWMVSAGVSYHLIIMGDGSVIDMETDDVASWSVLSPANEFSINAVFAGSYSHWTREEWLTNMQAGIKSAAWLAVRECRKFNIPLQILVGNNYPRIRTENGITDHYGITVTQLSPGSNHTDVGPNFPWDVFNTYVLQFAAAAASNSGDDFLSALSDDQQLSLLDKVNRIFGALFNDVESQSIYREPHGVNGSVPDIDTWATKDLIRNDDGMIHELYVEHSAVLGDESSLDLVTRVAAGQGVDTSEATVARATAVLKSVPADILKAYEQKQVAA